MPTKIPFVRSSHIYILVICTIIYFSVLENAHKKGKLLGNFPFIFFSKFWRIPFRISKYVVPNYMLVVQHVRFVLKVSSSENKWWSFHSNIKILKTSARVNFLWIACMNRSCMNRSYHSCMYNYMYTMVTYIAQFICNCIDKVHVFFSGINLNTGIH